MAAATAALSPAAASVTATTAAQDSVYILAYTTTQDEGRCGLRYAWSRDGEAWTSIGGGRSFLRCDYGLWGGEKRMLRPVLRYGKDGTWHCTWNLNRDGKGELGHAASADLVHWRRQTYFIDKNWNGDGLKTVAVDGNETTGSVAKAAWSVLEQLETYADAQAYRDRLYAEQAADDGTRFAGLKPVNMTIDVKADRAKPISGMLTGVFFEDINYGADGGLYAELVQNRDFEYAEHESAAEGWGPAYAWTTEGGGAAMAINTADPIHANNPHYATLRVDKPGARLVNTGYDGIAVRKGGKYDLSLFARLAGDGGAKAVRIKASLRGKDGREIAAATLTVKRGGWKQLAATLTAGSSADSAVLALEPLAAGSIDLDMVSLFPRHTFKGRKNGLRADLAQAIADIRPKVVRFPGGCVAHGQGLDNIYRWKNSIGALHARKPMKNLWGYHQSMGLGFYEYFQFCEDIGAEPLPVLAAGVPCQNSACIPGKPLGGGQQGGLPLDEMEAYIQDVLDLIDYANGDPKTNKWARMRAEAGHPEPFNLKYIGIGNEDQITDVFEVRFTMLYTELKKRHPEITVVGTAGPFYEGTDYDEGWAVADKLGVDIVDEHYYVAPGWFIYNQDFYDRYDRTKSKVYLGEYAAHLPGRSNNIETALAEAVYLTAVERNGDVVSMASYAPLLAKEGHTQWNPDLIYFNNTEVKPTVGYYVQQMFGRNAGDTYLPADIKTDNSRADVRCRIASSVVKDSTTGDMTVKLVNLLPVEVNATLNLPEGAADGQAHLTVLKGSPADKAARPEESAISLGGRPAYTMPPYSFSVIRISDKTKK